MINGLYIINANTFWFMCAEFNLQMQQNSD